MNFLERLRILFSGSHDCAGTMQKHYEKLESVKQMLLKNTPSNKNLQDEIIRLSDESKQFQIGLAHLIERVNRIGVSMDNTLTRDEFNAFKETCKSFQE